MGCILRIAAHCYQLLSRPTFVRLRVLQRVVIPDVEPDLIELQRAMVRTQKATVPR